MGLGTFAMSTSKFVSRIQGLPLQAKLSLHEGSWRHAVRLACNGTPHNMPPFCKKEVIKSPQRYKLETIVLRNRNSCASSPNGNASCSPLHRLFPYQLRIQQPMSKTQSYTPPGLKSGGRSHVVAHGQSQWNLWTHVSVVGVMWGAS